MEKDLIFSVVSWKGQDLEDPDEDEDSTPARYVLRIFGRTCHGRSVCVQTKYTPYFYLQIPANWPPFKMRQYLDGFARFDPALDMCKPVSAKTVYGFTNNEKRRFLRMAFHSHKQAKFAQRHAKKVASPMGGTTQIFEGNVPPELQLMHYRNLAAAGWMRVAKGSRVPPSRRVSHCDLEVEARWTDLHPAPDVVAAPPLVLVSWDLECYSPDGSFPDADEPACPIIQIGSTFQRFGEPEPYLRTVLVLGTCDPVEGVEVTCFPDEAALLRGWADLLRAHGPDVFIGYNTWQFDESYVFKRSVVLDIDLVFGKLRSNPIRLDAVNLKSSAYGDNNYTTFPTPGMLQVDLLVVVKKEHKLDSNTLNNVAEHFLGEHKVDMSPADLFESHRAGPAERARVAHYCSVDCELPLRIMAKLGTLANMLEMANATFVPVEYLLPRGQQVGLLSLYVPWGFTSKSTHVVAWVGRAPLIILRLAGFRSGAAWRPVAQ